MGATQRAVYPAIGVSSKTSNYSPVMVFSGSCPKTLNLEMQRLHPQKKKKHFQILNKFCDMVSRGCGRLENYIGVEPGKQKALQ